LRNGRLFSPHISPGEICGSTSLPVAGRRRRIPAP
jgi:hypothetical protein